MTLGVKETSQTGGDSTAADNRQWELFASAKTAEEFCRAWLALLCRQLGGVTAGTVLLESGETNTYVPIAVWPEPVGDLSRLAGVAQRALSEGRGIVQREPGRVQPAPAQIGYPLQVMDRTIGAVALEIWVSDEAKVSAVLRQLHWSVAWISDLFHRRELQEAGAKLERIGSVMEGIATALRQGRLQQTLFEVANHLARHLRCSRVALGLTEGHSVKVAALSDAAWFEKNSSVVKRYAAAMEEAFDKREMLTWRREDAAAGTAGAAASPHAVLAQESAASSIVSMPLLLGAACIGVLTLERTEGDAFGEAEHAWVRAFAGLLPPIIDQKRRAERGYWKRLQDDSRALLGKLFGPRHLVWKFGAAAAILVVALSILVEIDYRVSAKTVIEGEIQRVAAAPFEGFIAVSHVRAGDTVREGQILAELDDRDLKVEQTRWASEREQHDKKLREAMANRELAAIQVIGAQLRQAEAQLALAGEKIKRAKITAPFDGVVVSGDLSQLTGSPVEQGKKLFEIAPLSSYRVILQVDEREIRHVEVGQKGRLVISGIAGEPTPFSVVKVTPVATAQDGRNFFRVEARLEQAPPRLRPGMEGIGKVEVGEQRLWWVLTHSFTDWLRLTLWTWTL